MVAAKTDAPRAVEEPAAVPDLAPSIAPAISSPAAPPIAHPKRRLRLRVPIIAVLSALVLASGWRMRHRADARVTPAPASTIAVLPFSFRGAPELSYLHEGMASLLATSLDGVGGFSTVDPSTLLGLVSADPTASLDPARAMGAATQVGAGSFIVGEIVEASGRMNVSAALYSATPTPRLLARAAGEDTSSQIFALVDRLVAQLVTRQRGDTGQRLTKVAAVTTSSLPALKAYLEGEQRFRIGHYKEAVDAFQRAVYADSTFALAYYRLASAYAWSADTMMRPTALRATHFAERLAPADRVLVDAFLPFVLGDADEAERRYRAILSTRPFEGEAWYPLGEVLFHYNPVRGRSIEEARPVFTRALALGPSDSPLTHLLEIEAITGDYTAFDSLLKGIAPGAHFDLVGRTIHAFKRRDDTERRRMLAEIRSMPDLDLANVARHMLFLLDDRRGAEDVVSLLFDPERPREVQALGHILIAHLEASAGRMRAADSALRRAASLDRAHALENRGLLESLPFYAVSAARHDTTRALLEQWAPGSATGPAVVFTGDARLHQAFREYVLGLTYSVLERASDAEQSAAKLARVDVPEESREQVTALSHGVRARVAIQRRQPSVALRELQHVHNDHSRMSPIGTSPFFGFASERFVHAEALHALGRDEEALSWYRAFGEHSAYSRVFLAPAHRRQAEIYEKLGNRAEAAREYARFIALWRECDDELRPDVADAEARLKRLRVRD
jgi:tetratricopeptide (TPR) repeat protein